MNLIINTDGGVTKNSSTTPSLAYASFVAYTEDGTYFGSLSNELTATNNEAEYAAVALALATVIAKVNEQRCEWCGHVVPDGCPHSEATCWPEQDEGFEPGDTLTIRCDSRLVVEQIAGTFKTKNPRMKLWRDLVQAQIKVVHKLGFKVEFQLVPREQNKEADHLCNDAKVFGAKHEFAAPIPRRK